MKNELDEIIEKKKRKDFKEYITLLVNQDQKFFLRNEMLNRFRSYCDDKDKPQELRGSSSMYGFLKKVQELFILEDRIIILHR